MYQRIRSFIRQAITSRQGKTAALTPIKEQIGFLGSTMQNIAGILAVVSALQSAVNEILSQVSALRRDVANNVQEIAETKAGVSALQGESGDALSQVVVLRRDVVHNVQKIAETQTGVSALQGESGDALSQLIALRREVAAIKEGEVDYQLLMLQQQQLAQLTELEPDFRPIYEACRRFTMTSVERLFSLYHCTSYISRSGVPGHLAECGVWRGGSCMMMAYGLLKQSDKGRKIYLFDTYEGHPRPNAEKDVDLWGNQAADEWRQRQDEGRGWGAAPLPQVRKNLLSTGYPADQLVFIKGMVEDTIPANQPDALALLRLDTDWYDSTKAAINYLYPKLSPGGVLIIDDYGHYRGQREAVDEYFRSIGEMPLLQPVDYSCRVMVKPWREASGSHDADRVE